MKLDFSNEELVMFLLKAREHGWGVDAKESEKPQRPGFTEYDYSEGDFRYVDSYTGFFCFFGSEIVWFKGNPVWAMSYDGGMLEEYWNDLEFIKNTFEFLKKAMSLVKKERPFRGPEKFEEGDFTYTDESRGDIMRFTGREKILYKGKEVHITNYFGGIGINKD